MAEMVGSAVVQEAVGGVVSFMLGNREERASRKHRMERLEMAHSEIEFALARSSRMPITDRSILCRLQMIEEAYEECGEALHRHKVRIVENEEAEPQGVITHHYSTSSFDLPKKVLRAIKSYVSSFFSPSKDELSCSDVRRFEWFAVKASTLIRDVEVQPGCSLACRSFFRSILSELIEGRTLYYKLLQGSQTHHLLIEPMHSEENGVVAFLCFHREDANAPTKCFAVELVLRLSESTDIVRITINCLQSLGPQFKSLADEATIGELSRVLAQNVFYPHPLRHPLVSLLSVDILTNPVLLPMDNAFQSHSSGYSTLDPRSRRFPEQVISVYVDSYVSAVSSTLTNQLDVNIVRDWPLLHLSALFLPREFMRLEWLQRLLSAEKIGSQHKRIGLCPEEMEEMVLRRAIDCFIRQPELTSYEMSWTSWQGSALLTVAKTDLSSTLELGYMSSFSCKDTSVFGSVIRALGFRVSILSSFVDTTRALANIFSQRTAEQQGPLTL